MTTTTATTTTTTATATTTATTATTTTTATTKQQQPQQRRYSLFAAPIGGTKELRHRLSQLACPSHQQHEQHRLYRSDGRRFDRPPLRLIHAAPTTGTVMEVCFFPDTNAALRTTSELVQRVLCESNVHATDAFLRDCGYKLCGSGEYDVLVCAVRDCHIYVYAPPESGEFVRLSGRSEECVLQVSRLFSDIIHFEHPDNAVLR